MLLNSFSLEMHSMPNFAVLEGKSRHQPCSCQTSLRNDLFQVVQRISLHFKSPLSLLILYTKVFPKCLLLFESQASFQSEEFCPYDYAP